MATPPSWEKGSVTKSVIQVSVIIRDGFMPIPRADTSKKKVVTRMSMKEKNKSDLIPLQIEKTCKRLGGTVHVYIQVYVARFQLILKRQMCYDDT